jgi:hypothetical protein
MNKDVILLFRELWIICGFSFGLQRFGNSHSCRPTVPELVLADCHDFGWATTLARNDATKEGSGGRGAAPRLTDIPYSISDSSAIFFQYYGPRSKRR